MVFRIVFNSYRQCRTWHCWPTYVLIWCYLQVRPWLPKRMPPFDPGLPLHFPSKHLNRQPIGR